MPKSIFLLLFCVLPFTGTSQSSKKLNKQLLASYIEKYHAFDSVMLLHEKDLALWKTTKDAFYDTIKRFRELDEKYYALQDSISDKQYDLERLGVEKVKGVDNEYVYAFYLSRNNFEFIISPFFQRLGFLDGLFDFDLSRDSISDLELFDLDFQNEYLQGELGSIDRFISMAASNRAKMAESLIAMDTTQLKLTEIKQTLKEKVPTLRNYNLLLEKEVIAKKQLFAKNGPKGFDEVYFEVFPDVFPPKPSSKAAEPIQNNIEIVEGDDDGESGAEFPPPPPMLDDVVHTFVEESPEFPGGMTALKAYIEANLKIPEVAIQQGLEGKCYLQFIVSKSGNVSNVEVKRGVPDCPECDAEAIRMVKSMPKWKPGKNGGKPVNCLFNLPVRFKLPEENHK